MAFLAPAAAGAVSATAGASALASGAALASGGGLASGLAAGTALGSGAAMSAMPALSYAGANLAAPGLLGALPSAVAPTAGIFSQAMPALGGLQSLAPTVGPGIFAKAAPALGGLSSMAPTVAQTAPGLFQTAGMSPLGGMQSVLPSTAQTLASGAYNPAYAEMLGKQFATNLPPVGSPDVAKTMLASTDKISPMAFKPPPPSAQFLNTVQEGAALPGVTSNLPAQTFGNVAGGPAIPKVTSALPVSATPTALTPASVSPIEPGQSFLTNLGNLIKNPSMDAAVDYAKEHPYATAGAAYGLYSLMKPKQKQPEVDKGMIRPYEYTRTQRPEAYATSPVSDTSERLYFNEQFTPREAYPAKEGGLLSLAVGGPIETMAAMNAVGANTGYPMAAINTPMYANPMMQRPEAVNVLSPSGDAGVGAYSGEPKFAEGGSAKTEGEYKYSFDPKTNTFTQLSTPRYADEQIRNAMGMLMTSPTSNRPALETGSKTAGGIAAPVGGAGIAALPAMTAAAPAAISPYQSPEQQLGLSGFYEMMNRRLAEMSGYPGYAGGGLSHLGDYSDGGRLLKGPGDGVSDSIPAVIGERQPARLADGEFVVPARIVSELGNGSTEAGARKLYAMMDRIQKARGKSVGKGRVAVNTKADKHLPA